MSYFITVLIQSIKNNSSIRFNSVLDKINNRFSFNY